MRRWQARLFPERYSVSSQGHPFAKRCRVAILVPETVGAIGVWTGAHPYRSELLSRTKPRSAPKGTHYLADLFPTLIVLVVIKALRQSLIFQSGCMVIKQICLFYEETPSHGPIPHNQNGTMAKDAWLVRNVYWRRERAHDKTGERVVFVVCTAGAFIGCQIA